MDSQEKQIIDYLILNGALEAAGISEKGEPLYNFTKKLKEVMPELYNEHINYVNAELMGLWEKGFITMDLFQENPSVRLTDLAFDDVMVSNLSEQEQFSIREIKRILLQ